MRHRYRFKYRCKHVSLIERGLFNNETEYLFAPYSVFTVKSVRWSSIADEDNPHIVELEAAIDNRRHKDNLPSAPWG